MTSVVHLVVGPAEHGVVRHGLRVAAACGQRVEHVVCISELGKLPRCDVVHVPFTDRLFGPTAEAATRAFGWVVGAVKAAGAELSVTLHDVPYDDSVLQRRRRATYLAVLAAARGVVVNSLYELAHIEGYASSVHSLRMIRLPMERAETVGATGSRALPPAAVAVLGFVFPDRGYESVIAALPSGSTLVAVGRAAEGHEDLPARYRRLAGGRFCSTGFVPDAELGPLLAGAAVPVAPNRRVTASASIDTWLAHGRRPLVPDTPYIREILEARPGSLLPYDPDEPAGLPAALRSALADPATTRLPAGTRFGPAPGEVAEQYRRHLASCVTPAVVRTRGGCTVPDNRWDLLPPPAGEVSVSVVVPYYNAQRSLDLVLAGLAAQTHRDLEVIVVDDGSDVAPDLAEGGAVPIRLIRQANVGFRAARARNLGARAAGGQVLVFLDGDTVPEPQFVARLARRVAASIDLLAVGRRRHTDFAGVFSGELVAFLRRAATRGCPDPTWLSMAYRSSGDLLTADRRSYRFVISAVLAIDARLFAELGGFDERFVDYGGEDWEFAHRARTGGALLVHEPAAVAWHDGPDWAGRGDDETRRAAKASETATLARLLPDPDARGSGRSTPYPSVIVRGGRLRDVDALHTVRSAFAAGADCGFWFDAIDGSRSDLVWADPRVAQGAPPPDVRARAWCHAWLHGPVDLAALMALADSAERHGTIVSPALTLHSARSLARSSRHSADGAAAALSARLFGHHDRSSPSAIHRDDHSTPL